MPGSRVFRIVTIVCALPAAATAFGQFSSQSDGSDGAFNPQENVEVDLSLAATATWDTPSPVPGNGVYDSQKWAVVFKYTEVNIPAGVTVTFKNHASGAPVVWLTTGNVFISGTLKLDGGKGKDHNGDNARAEPGPGGFQGGMKFLNGTLVGSGGIGPGGGGYGWGAGGGGHRSSGNGGVHNCIYDGQGGQPYGNESVNPLIGGSGGAGSSGGHPYDEQEGGGGGAGGGSILIASSGDILLQPTGKITANGGNGGGEMGGAGSGGGIRLVANSIAGDGLLRAIGGSGHQPSTCYWGGGGSKGFIRVEAEVEVSLADAGNPYWSTSTPGPIFPPAHAPQLRIANIETPSNGLVVPAPDDPVAGALTTDLSIDEPGAAIVSIEAINVPPDTSVTIIIVPARGDRFEIESDPLIGSFAFSTTTALVTFPPGRAEIQLRANWTPVP